MYRRLLNRIAGVGSLLAILLVAIVAATGGSSSLAQTRSSGASGPSGPKGSDGAPIPIPRREIGTGDPTNAPGRREARERAQEAGEARERKSKTPEAKAERKAAKEAHRALKRDPALALAQKAFPELLEQSAFEPFHLSKGERVTKWLDDYAVKIESDSKKPARLIESLLPVRSRDAAGRPVPTDYALTGNADWYWPTAPHAQTLLAKTADGGVKFPDIDVNVAPGAGEAADVAAVKTKDKLFYANAGTDVDHVATPIPGGVELSIILRSEQSPERYSYDFDLPAGARLQQSSSRLGGIEIVKGETLVAIISPPVAWDADQTPVPLKYRVAGDKVVIDVEHRDADFKMPIVIDPSITEDQRYWYTNPGAIDKIGWEFGTNNPPGFTAGIGGYLGDGLYLYHRGVHGYGAGNFSNWAFSAPGDSRVTRAEFGYVSHEPQTYGNWPEPYNDDYLYEGIYARTFNGFEAANWCEPDGTCGSSPFFAYQRLRLNYKSHISLGTPGNQAIFGMANYYAGDHTDFTGYMGSAAVVLTDYNAPAVTEDYGLSDTAWTPYRAFQGRGTDGGLGTKRLAVDSPGNPGWPNAFTYESPCTGDRRSRCPSYVQVTDNTFGLPEGLAVPVRYTATDIVGNASSRTWQLNVDRTPPAVTYGGDLPSLNNRLELSGQDYFTTHITVTDGSTAGGSSTRRSGAASVVLRVDGAVEARADSLSSCVDSCALDLDYEFSYDDYVPGSTHTVRVETVDRAGNRAPDAVWTVRIPSSSDFQVLVDTWRNQVLGRVDAGSPLPIVGVQPVAPNDYSFAENCEASAANVTACYDRIQQFLSDTKQWLDQNTLPTFDFSQLPEFPTYGWAPVLTSHLLSNALSDGFSALKTSYASATTSLGVGLTFNTPQTAQQVMTLLGDTVSPSSVQLRGVFEPEGAAITGATTQITPRRLSDHIAQFYAKQAVVASQESDEMSDQVNNPGGSSDSDPLDADDVNALNSSSNDMRRMAAALNQGQGFVTGVMTTVPAVQLRALLRVPQAAIRSIGAVPINGVSVEPGGLLKDILDDSETSAEVARWAAERRGSGSRSAAGVTTLAVPAYANKTCDQAGDVASKAQGNPATYMPNRVSAKVALDGSAESNGLHNKVAHIFMRWTRQGALSWYCSGPSGKRNYEPEFKPYDNGIIKGPQAERRWSSDWTNEDYTSSLPKAYKDDLACGAARFLPGPPKCSGQNVAETSTYPDFAIGSGRARNIKYGVLYDTRAQTNSGEKDSGLVLIRGGQTRKTSNLKNSGYCRVQSLAHFHKYLDRYCLNNVATKKVMTIGLRSPRYVHKNYDWTGPATSPADADNIGTDLGSGAP